MRWCHIRKYEMDNSQEKIAIAAECCHELLHEALERSKGIGSQGPRDNLNILCRHMKKVRSLSETGKPRKIGVFGPPKRGKSSLLNALLRKQILPTGKEPKSNTVVEIHGDEQNNAQPWTVTITYEDDFQQPNYPREEKDVLEIIEQYGVHVHSNPARIPAKYIEVLGAFPDSYLFRHNTILLDTPGAETAFGSDNSSSLEEDTRRALAMLDETHIVLFVARIDQPGSQSEMDFYQKHMRLLGSVNVVNFLDKWDSKEEPDDPRLSVCRNYGCPMDRTLAVSAKQALEAIENKDEEKLKKSNLLDLEKFLKKEIDDLQPEKAIIICLDKLIKIPAIMGDEAKAKRVLRLVDVDRLKKALEKCKEELAEPAIKKLSSIHSRLF